MHTPQKIWQRQSAATIGIMQWFGHSAAFDCQVVQKHLSFTTAATTHPALT